MKTIKPVIAPFLALVLALFAAVSIPKQLYAQSHPLTFGGYHDDGVGPDGNHYFELYWYSDSTTNCTPYDNPNYIDVWFNGANKESSGGWIPANDVFESYHGVSGFSHHECQVNVYASNGTGLRQIGFGWVYNGNTQPGEPTYNVTF